MSVEETIEPSTAVASAAGTCSTCKQPVGPTQSSQGFVYAIGRVEPRFPRLGVEKEFAQQVRRVETKGQTDRQVMHTILSRSENRYLVRQMCWALTVEGIDTWVLLPRHASDFSLLVEALRQTPSSSDIDVVIGTVGPAAPSELCNGLTLPIVVFDQLYSFDQKDLLGGIPKPENVDEEQFRNSSQELLDRVMQLADNNGASDSHRAVNYLAVRYPAVYARVAAAFQSDQTLAAVDVMPSRLAGARNVVDVVFSFVDRSTDVTEKYFVRVDVTEEFPFLVTKLSPYFSR